MIQVDAFAETRSHPSPGTRVTPESAKAGPEVISDT